MLDLRTYRIIALLAAALGIAFQPGLASASKRRTHAPKRKIAQLETSTGTAAASKAEDDDENSEEDTRPPGKIAAKGAAKGLAKSSPKVPEGPLTIDVLKDRVLNAKKRKSVQSIQKAIEALRDKKFDLARKFAQSVEKDELFSDYGYALIAKSYVSEAGALADKKAYNNSIAMAKKATTLLLQLEQNFPYSPFAKKLPEELAEADLIIANDHHAKKLYKTAATHYERAFQRLSPSNLNLVRPDTLKRYAQSCQKERSILCDSWLQKFVIYYPRNSEEMKAIAEFLPDEASKAKPAAPTGKVTQAYKSPDLDLAALEAALSSLFEGKHGDAEKALRKFAEDYPKSQYLGRARYWLGQSLAQQKDTDKARKVFEDLVHDSPLSYYGLLASMASGKPTEAMIDSASPVATPTDPYLQPADVLKLKRAEQFLAEGQSELALQELKEIKARESLSSPFLIYLATMNFEAANYFMSYMEITELMQRNYPGIYTQHGLRLMFPVVYMDLINKYASKYQLDPILVLSLIKQESAFDTSAGSATGASGLMQLMYPTAVETESGIKRADLILADTNIRVGCKYIKKMLAKFNGNISLALAAYNAGPAAVDRWLKDGRSKLGMLEFIESIPYRETREYVSYIVRNYYWYHKRLSPESPRQLTYFWTQPPGAASSQPPSSASPETQTAKDPQREPTSVRKRK